jgi:hypothetical protein
MRSMFTDVALIQNRQIVTETVAQISSQGQLLICHGCNNCEVLIMAFLVLEESDQVWALCGACVRRILYGAIA